MKFNSIVFFVFTILFFNRAILASGVSEWTDPEGFDFDESLQLLAPHLFLPSRLEGRPVKRSKVVTLTSESPEVEILNERASNMASFFFSLRMGNQEFCTTLAKNIDILVQEEIETKIIFRLLQDLKDPSFNLRGSYAHFKSTQIVQFLETSKKSDFIWKNQPSISLGIDSAMHVKKLLPLARVVTLPPLSPLDAIRLSFLEAADPAYMFQFLKLAYSVDKSNLIFALEAFVCDEHLEVYASSGEALPENTKISYQFIFDIVNGNLQVGKIKIIP